MAADDSHTAVNRLEPADFAVAFGETPSAYLAARIDGYDFRYRALGRGTREYWLRRVMDALLSGNLERAGEARAERWEEGWGAHLAAITEPFDPATLSPKYFGKYGVVRWRQDYIAPLDPDFERRSLAVIQDWLFDKYMRQAPAVYEFGCGTGHNLLRVRDVNPTATLCGLDWTEASQKVLARVAEVTRDAKLSGRRFNFFQPDADLKLAPGAVVYTSAALEQTGNRFNPFIDYLVAQRPALCVHIEPIAELLDESHLFDYLSVRYFERRNYLSGFLGYLRALERDGLIDIKLARRSYIGSLFIDGYSVVAWSPR
jgi:hypothetical protein